MSEAATLADAFRESAALRPAWILLDLMLPDGNGTELLRRVRQDRELGNAAGLGVSKVCVITGCGAAAVHEARTLEPDHLFTKPLNVDGLLSAMTMEDVAAEDAGLAKGVAV